MIHTNPTPSDTEETPQLTTPTKIVPPLVADFTARQSALDAGRPLGAVSGIPALDDVLSGSFMPGLHIVNGSPGIGKTAFVLQLAGACLCPSLFVSCEIHPVELFRRLIASHTGTFLDRLKTGDKHRFGVERLTPVGVQVLAMRTADAFPGLTIADGTEGGAGIENLAKLANIARNNPRAEDLPGAGNFLAVVDSAHTWAGGVPEYSGVPEYDRLNVALDDLKLLSKTLDAPVLVVAERNRASMAGGGQSSSAGSRKFEYVAETMMELDYTKGDKSGENEIAVDHPKFGRSMWREVTLTISKNRHGRTTRIPLLWHGAMQCYIDGDTRQ
jgi:hypothetical protein